jgi:hypothetical protein
MLCRICQTSTHEYDPSVYGSYMPENPRIKVTHKSEDTESISVCLALHEKECKQNRTVT